MVRDRSLSALLCAAMSLCAFAASARAETFEDLRGGGVTLFLRHATAEWSDAGNEIGALDPARLDTKACASKRRLTEDGRLQARAIALALQGLDLGPLDIHTAGLCRTFETARTLGAAPRVVVALTPMQGQVPSVRAQGEAIEKIVRAGQQARGLRVIIGDYEAIQALYGVTLSEGDGLVLKSVGDGAEPVARIMAADWTSLQPFPRANARGLRFGSFDSEVALSRAPAKARRNPD
jgi:phosphohistidine phosphatase SixA